MNRTTLLARTLALLWAVFWLSFFVAESLAWHTPAGVTVSWGCVGLSFVVLAFLPWRWERTGGVALALFGLLIAAAYSVWSPPHLPLPSRVITAVVLGGPPFAAGVISWRHHRRLGRSVLRARS
jgi:hypothetical protein